MRQAVRNAVLTLLIHAAQRIASRTGQVKMLQQRLVVVMTQLGPNVHHFFEPIARSRRFDLWKTAVVVVDDLLQAAVGLADAPLDRPMDFGVFLAPRRVQRHEWIAEIMAQHAGRKSAFGPFAAAEGIDEPAIPATRLLRRSAPVLFPDVQHMIAKISEADVRRFAASEIFAVVMQKQVAPTLRIRTAQVPQCIDGNAMMRRATNAAEDGGEKQGHGRSQIIRNG